MKLRKKINIFLTVIIAVIMICLNLTACTASSDNTSEMIPKAGAGFMEVCDSLFTGNGETYDAEGMDVTNNFTAKYSSAYHKEDYAAILEGCYEDEISQICVHEYTDSQTSTESVLRLTYKESSVHFVKQTTTPYNGKMWYLIVTAEGSCGYQDSDGSIIGASSPEVSYQFSEFDGFFSGSVTSTKTTAPVISTDKTSVKFQVTTTHVVNCPRSEFDGGVDSETVQMGPFITVSSFIIKVP